DLTELARDIAAHGQRPVFIIYPALYHPGMSDSELTMYRNMGWNRAPLHPQRLLEIEEKHSALRRIARETGAQIIDLQGTISNLAGADRAALFLDEMHPSKLGNQRFAELIANSLQETFHPVADSIR